MLRSPIPFRLHSLTSVRVRRRIRIRRSLNIKNALQGEAEAIDLILPHVPGFVPMVKYEHVDLTQKMSQVPGTLTRFLRLV